MSEKNKQEMVYGVHPLQQALALGKRECYKIVLEKGKPPARLASLLELAETHRPVWRPCRPRCSAKNMGNSIIRASSVIFLHSKPLSWKH